MALTGFRSFIRAELQFAAGQNYVFGHNWQGKSSIVDAVGFALFGVDIFPKKIAGTAVKADHLINERSDRGGVELTFDLDGTEYCLKRQLPGRDVLLAKNGETIASGVRTVTEKLVALLGIDVKLFQNIFFSDQDELRKSLEFSPEERRVFIERLLGVEEWKDRLDSLRETRRRLEGFLDDLTSGRLGVFLSHVEELEESVELRKDEVRGLDASLKKRAGRSPKTVRTLRREERKLESAVATLQHKELEIRTQLARDQYLRDGISRGRCPACTQVVPEKLRRSRLATMSRSIREMEKTLARIAKDLRRQEAALDDAGYDESHDQLFEQEGDKARLQALSEQLALDEARLKKLRRQAKTFGKKPQQVERTKSEIAFLLELEGVIQEFRRSLRGRLVRELAVGTNDFLARFHDGDNDSSVRIDDDLNIAVALHGREVPIFNLSGAAKDILALALRYGLLRVAAKGISFLILDEPTRHMDSSNCQRLKSLFNDLLDRQLIVVTVNSEFSDASGRHFRVEKNESLDSVIAETW